MAALNFPDDRTGLVPPGTGPLQDGDVWRAPNGVSYTWNTTAAGGYWSATFQNDSTDTLSQTFLRLDTANAPLLGDLTIGASDQIDLETNGKGTFVGPIIVGADPDDDTPGTRLDAQLIKIRRDTANANATCLEIFKGEDRTCIIQNKGDILVGGVIDNNANAPKIHLHADGSANFAGVVTGTQMFLSADDLGSNLILSNTANGTDKVVNMSLRAGNNLNKGGISAGVWDSNLQNGYLAFQTSLSNVLNTRALITAGGDFRINPNGFTPSSDAAIDLKADGSASFVGQVDSGNISVGDGCRLNPGGNIEVRADGGIQPAFNVLRDGTAASNSVATVYNDGSALFTTTVNANTANATDDVTVPGAFLSSAGSCYATRPASDGNLKVWGGFLQGTAEPTSEILANGSAEFAGQVQVNPDSGLALTVNTDRFIFGADGSFTSAREGASVRMHQSAFQVPGGSVPLAVYDVESDDKKPVAYIKADGSASFAGGIDSSSSTTNGMQIDFNGGIAVQRSGDTGLAFTVLYRKENTVNITADGSAEFAGGLVEIDNQKIYIKSDSDGNAYSQLGRLGFVETLRSGTAASAPNDVAYRARYSISGTISDVIKFNYDGSANFVGGVTSAYVYTNTPDGSFNTLINKGANDALNTVIADGGGNQRIKFYNDGNATFDGDIDANNVSFKLEPDNDDNYTVTTDVDGNETRVYNGPTLDVKERLTKADNALQALKTAAATATDFAELKSAIVNALANI